MKTVSLLILLVLLCAAVPAVSAAETYVVTATWGTNGSGNGQLYYPEDIALDAAGNVYVTDGGNQRIQKFTSNGTFITTWGTGDSEPGGSYGLSGIAVDGAGNIYVTETGTFRVLKFTSTGTLITKWGTEGTGDGQFRNPMDVAVDGAGSVYVTDLAGATPYIKKFTSNGTFVTKWRTFSNEVTYSQPMGIAADSAGHVYVVDLSKNLVQKYTSTGTLLAEWGTEGSGDGQFTDPMGIAVDGTGCVYVTEPSANRVQKFTSDGTFITKWGSAGTGAGEFNNPRGIAVDSAGSVYVVDAFNQRIQKFAVGTGPAPMPTVTATPTPSPTMMATISVPPTSPTTSAPTATATPTVTVTATPPPTSGPYPGPHVPSVRIEAENFDAGGEGVAYHDLEPENLGNSNYRAGEGVDVETENGVMNVAYIRDGEYLKYSVDTTADGGFTLVLHAANPDATAKEVEVYIDGVEVGEVLIGGTGSWTTYRDFTMSTPLTIPVGRHVVKLEFEGINRINLDWLSLSAGTPPTTTTVAPTPQTTPCGPGNNIPGRVQAENFDKSGTGAANAAYADTTILNEGGSYRTSEPVDIEYNAGIANYDVGWIRTGEYLIYTVQVTNGGAFTAQFNAANPDTENKAIDVYVDGAKVGTAQIGATGSFGTFKKFAFPMALTTGKHQIKLAFPSQRLNLDYVEFANGGTVTTTIPATGGSFTAAPLTAAFGSAVKFTVTPAPGKTVKSAWWSFDATAHLQTWNSRNINPTFFYPQKGTFSPLVQLTYTDNSVEEIKRAGYIHAT